MENLLLQKIKLLFLVFVFSVIIAFMTMIVFPQQKIQDNMNFEINKTANLFEENQCNHGMFIQNKCKCDSEWIGPKCSIKISRIFHQQNKVLKEQYQYLQLSKTITGVEAKQNIQIFYASPQTDLETYFNDQENPNISFIKIDREVGDLQKFEQSNYVFKQLFYYFDLITYSLVVIMVIITVLLHCAKLFLPLAQNNISAQTNNTSFQKSNELEQVKFNYKKIKSSTKCSICLLRPKQSKIVLHCKHIFHQSCITQWHRIDLKCPLCRQHIQKIKN